MGTRNKKQVYPYSMRTVASSVGTMCGSHYFFLVTPPENALTIETLFTHVVFQFDVSVSSANQTVYQIGIADTISGSLPVQTYGRYLTINQAADANRRIDLKLDLSALLLHTKPALGVDMILNTNLAGVSTIGVMEFWKSDNLYTTQAIR